MANDGEGRQINICTREVERYHKIIRELRLPEGVSTTDHRRWELTYWSIGAAVLDDYMKGYVYLQDSPKPLLRTLDGFEPRGRDRSTVYRSIGGHWYLYYEFIPD